MIFRTFSILLALLFFSGASAQENTDTTKTQEPVQLPNEVADTLLKNKVDSAAVKSIEKKQIPASTRFMKETQLTL